MAPIAPRTIPPWVVKRPPQPLLPQHNSEPYDPRGDDLPRTSHTHSRPPTQARPHTQSTSHSPPPSSATGRPLAPDGSETDLTADDGQKNGPFPQLFKRKGGRKWDHLRSAEPVIVSQHLFAAQNDVASQWRDFVESTRYPHMPNEESEVVDEEAMEKLRPSLRNPTELPRVSEANDSARGRSLKKQLPPWYRRMMSLPLRHPLGPFFCRLAVLSTSIMALALAATIFQNEDLDDDLTAQRTQIIVAVVVDCVAIPYIGYITIDDYFGKPLGLRPPKDRVRLILMDLFFIIFKSASTALGFQTMIYFPTPTTMPHVKALASFELVGLVAWAMTLTINIFREIERLGG